MPGRFGPHVAIVAYGQGCKFSCFRALTNVLEESGTARWAQPPRGRPAVSGCVCLSARAPRGRQNGGKPRPRWRPRGDGVGKPSKRSCMSLRNKHRRTSARGAPSGRGLTGLLC